MLDCECHLQKSIKAGNLYQLHRGIDTLFPADLYNHCSIKTPPMDKRYSTESITPDPTLRSLVPDTASRALSGTLTAPCLPTVVEQS
jgi:hypothetical protein